jgi:hypothetical protein
MIEIKLFTDGMISISDGKKLLELHKKDLKSISIFPCYEHSMFKYMLQFGGEVGWISFVFDTFEEAHKVVDKINFHLGIKEE